MHQLLLEEVLGLNMAKVRAEVTFRVTALALCRRG